MTRSHRLSLSLSDIEIARLRDLTPAGTSMSAVMRRLMLDAAPPRPREPRRGERAQR